MNGINGYISIREIKASIVQDLFKVINGYISIREASYRWGVSERRVNQYCAEGRIPGASRFGRSWAIPENAEKPSDPRFQGQHRDSDRTST